MSEAEEQQPEACLKVQSTLTSAWIRQGSGNTEAKGQKLSTIGKAAKKGALDRMPYNLYTVEVKNEA